MGRMTYRGGSAGNMGGVPGGDIGRAKLALQSGRPDEAERLCRKRLERRPEDTLSRLLLAQALLQQQRPDEAITEARRVTREQSTNADAFLILSAALTQKQSSRYLQEAEEAARRAVQLQPKRANARVQLAEVLAARNNLKDARIEAEEATRLEPRLAAGHLIRAIVTLADKDPEEAVKAADSAIRYDDAQFAAHLTRANALVQVGRHDDALVSLNRAQTLNPTMPVQNFQTQRARIYLKQRKWGAAYNEFILAQKSSGRLVRFAPILAALNMSMVFGQYGPVVVILVILLAIMAGLFFIPVAGPWIVAVLFLAFFGFSFFSVLRQYEGRILPAGGARIPALAAIVVAALAIFALTVWISTFITHGLKPAPTTLFIAGMLALGAGVGVAYGWPRLAGRLGRA
ncbi:MAG TPA: tetratricopeptide repeat protein [Ktedonobacterales bacterium]